MSISAGVTATASTVMYSLALHDALPIFGGDGEVAMAWPAWGPLPRLVHEAGATPVPVPLTPAGAPDPDALLAAVGPDTRADRKSTRLNSSHSQISYAVFCLKKKIDITIY